MALRGIHDMQRRVAAAVSARRRTDPAPDDPFRGLYISDEQVDALLAVPAAGEPTRLDRLASAFDLSELDVELLLVALAPDLDSRFERLYGYLNDDVSRRRGTVGLALELCGHSPAERAARARLLPAGPLTAGGLVEVEEPDRPLLTRPLRVPDRVTAYLLGDDHPDPRVRPLLDAVTPPFDGIPAGALRGAADLARALGSGPVYLRERPGSAARDLAVAALERVGLGALQVALDRVAPAEDVITLAALLAREARLGTAGLVLGPVEAALSGGAHAVRALADLPVPVLLVGHIDWDSAWSTAPALIVDVPVTGPAERIAVWRAHLDGELSGNGVGALASFSLGPEQIARAVAAGRTRARMAGAPLTVADLQAGARAQNAAGLARLARRVEPAVGWADLVLPEPTLQALRELADRGRHRDLVLREWRMRPGGARGTGVCALFAGDSGTGKTMSAEVIAGDLGLSLYTVNLATVVDKYVGETEKNLERIFTEAVGVNGVLLFDEADAIFGKRSEVRDAHDRYANVETAYLLQRLESFDGLAILATNLRANLDEAFTRRLDAVVDFPMPEPTHRLALWHRCLTRVPTGSDLDLEFCAQAFELSGGNIRSIAITAAYLAAAANRPLRMVDLIQAIQREYRKLGRLCLPSEFGPYHALLS